MAASLLLGWMLAHVLDILLISEALTEYQLLVLTLALANLFYQAADEHTYKRFYLRNFRFKDLASDADDNVDDEG